MARNRSWPAVSHICSVIRLSSTVTCFWRKDAPMVWNANVTRQEKIHTTKPTKETKKKPNKGHFCGWNLVSGVEQDDEQEQWQKVVRSYVQRWKRHGTRHGRNVSSNLFYQHRSHQSQPLWIQCRPWIQTLDLCPDCPFPWSGVFPRPRWITRRAVGGPRVDWSEDPAWPFFL